MRGLRQAPDVYKNGLRQLDLVSRVGTVRGFPSVYLVVTVKALILR